MRKNGMRRAGINEVRWGNKNTLLWQSNEIYWSVL